MAVVAAINVHKKNLSKAKKAKLERVLEWLAALSAILVLFAIISEHELDNLREAERQNTGNSVRSMSSELDALSRDRTITEAHSNLFMLLIKDYPKTPIKVFVGIGDYEADKYARKIRQLLDAAGYVDNGEAVIRIPGVLVTAPTITEQSQFSTNAIAFVMFGKATNWIDTVIPISQFGEKPVISPGLTNDVNMLNRGILGCVKWGFSKIEMDGIYLWDDTFMKPGEVGILVPPKNH